MVLNNRNDYRYYAFISYSHKDIKFAKWLQKSIENYGLPATLNGMPTQFPKRLRPIFRDESDLGCGYLSDSILSALSNSKYLIVICSTESKTSKWCNWEIEEFVKTHPRERIIPIVLRHNSPSDDVNNYYPPSLSILNSVNEFLAIDIKIVGKELALTKIIAYMLEIGVEELWRRDKRRLRMKYTLFFLTLLISLLISVFITFSFRNKNIEINHRDDVILENLRQITNQRDSIEQLINKTISENLNFKIEKAFSLSEEKHLIEALLYLDEVMVNYPDMLSSKDKEKICILYRDIYNSIPPNIAIKSIEHSDGKEFFKYRDIELVSKDSTIRVMSGAGWLDVDDLKSGKRIISIGNEECVYFETYASPAVLDISEDNRFVLVKGGDRFNSYLSLTDLKTTKIHLLSSWKNYDDIIQNNYYESGQFVADGTQLMIYGPAGLKIMNLPSLRTVVFLKDVFDQCLYNNSDDSYDIFSNLLKEKATFIFVPERRDLLFQIKCESIIWDVDVNKNTIAIATEMGIQIWNVNEKKKENEVLTDFSIRNVKFNHSGTMIATNTGGGILFLCSSDGKIISDIDFVFPSCMATLGSYEFFFSPNDEYLIIYHDGDMIVYSIFDKAILFNGVGGHNVYFENERIFVTNGKRYRINKDSVDFINNCDTHTNNIDSKNEKEDMRFYRIFDDDSSIQYIVYPDDVIDVVSLNPYHYDYAQRLSIPIIN